MNNNNDLKYSLPLQINLNIYNLDKLSSLRSRDMPKQLKNDIYRQNQRSNLDMNRADQISIANQIFNTQDEALFREKPILTIEKHKSNTNLRDLIKKKLLEAQANQEKSAKVKNMIPISNIPKENRQKQLHHNRYQSILRQFYGNPNKNKVKNSATAIKSSKKQQKSESLRKYKSLKKLNQPQPSRKNTTLSKYHSQASLYTKSPINSQQQPLSFVNKDNQLSKKLTYLDIYMQKKRLYL